MPEPTTEIERRISSEEAIAGALNCMDELAKQLSRGLSMPANSRNAGIARETAGVIRSLVRRLAATQVDK